MNIDILSTWWFIFFLLIIIVGYLFVEILFWKKYFYRHIFKEYKNNLFDRILHYVFWGIIVNLAFFYLYYFTDSLTPLINYFNTLWEASKSLKPIFWDSNNFQFIIFSIFYFINIFILLWTIKIFVYLLKLIANIEFKPKKMKKNTKRKNKYKNLTKLGEKSNI